jgi:signal transduction histidine kinase
MDVICSATPGADCKTLAMRDICLIGTAVGTAIGTTPAGSSNMSDADGSADQQTIRQSLLIQRMAAVGSLAEGLAHEVHNPLNCALLQLAVLQRRLEQPDCEPSTLQPVARLVEQALRRLELLFNDFVSLQPRSAFPTEGDEP